MARRPIALRCAAMETPSAESQRVFAPEIFRDRSCIVTGGGSGIGLATARELARLGAKIAICGRTKSKLDTAADELRSITPHVLAIACDIREPEQVEAMVGEVLGAFG